MEALGGFMVVVILLLKSEVEGLTFVFVRMNCFGWDIRMLEVRQ